MPGVCNVPGVDLMCDGIAGAVGSAVGNFIDAAAKAFGEALGKLTAVLLTFWTNVKVPGDLADPGGPVAFMRSSTSWVTAFILIISIMIAGAKMVITHKGDPGVEAAKGIWQMVLYSAAGIPAIALLGIAGDQFSDWIINRAADGDLGNRMGALYGVAQLNPLGPGLVLIVALLGILSALGQMFLMIVRVGMLILLAGLLPMSAAAAVSKGGKQWLAKTLGWLLAFLVYKPAAAIIYATAFAMIGKSSDPATVLSGLFLTILSILALPALLRLTVPVTSSIAEHAGGGAAAGVAAGGAVASGAMQMRALRGGGGAGSGGGGKKSSGPTGSPTTGGAGRPQGTGGGQAKPPMPTGGGGTAGAGAGAAGAGAGAAAKAHPVGAAAAAGVQAVQGGVQAVRNVGEQAAGPSGSERSES